MTFCTSARPLAVSLMMSMLVRSSTSTVPSAEIMRAVSSSFFTSAADA